jgi:hypothetical protein
MVMSNTKHDNESRKHNDTITPRPAILVPATGKNNDGWIWQMGREGPQVIEADWSPLPPYAEWGLDPPETVVEFTGAFMRVGTPERATMEANVSAKDRETLHSLLKLRAASETAPKAARRELAEAAKKLIPDARLRATFQAGHLPEVAEWFYPAYFNRELKGARLVLWLTKQKRFLPAIFCPNMKTAMFAFAAFRGVAACRNCGTLFTLDSERPDKSKSEHYCTAACGQRYRQKTYRKRSARRKKKEVKQQSGLSRVVRRPLSRPDFEIVWPSSGRQKE